MSGGISWRHSWARSVCGEAQNGTGSRRTTPREVETFQDEQPREYKWNHRIRIENRIKRRKRIRLTLLAWVNSSDLAGG